ncbi:MAG: secretin N-terminal domain-containing protein [Verrucomicrobiota bacterium]
MCVVVGLAGGLRAQDTPVQPPAAPTPPAVVAVEKVAAAPEVAATPVAPAQPEVKPAEPANDQVVIDYHEADIQNIIRTLAAKSGINIIVGEEVVGKVTLHLEGVTYADALRLIVESKGYAYVTDKKNVVRIKTKESLDAEPVEARLISLNYSKAEEVKKTLDALLSRQGKIQVDTRGNALVILDTPTSLAKIAAIIEKMDTQTTQVMIEAKFVETTKNPKKDLGLNWSQTLTDHRFSAGPFSLTKDLNGGPWVASTALLDAGSATMLFSFMSNDTDSELLASPRVVTIDNVKAKIAIAQQYPIPTFTYSESKGAFSVSGFEYKDIGIVLNCIPHINKNDFVTLEVAPEVGNQAGVATFQGIDIPIIDNRTATTTVLIKSGNTLAIGGLIQQDTLDRHTKVPVMGDIPGVGALFRSKSLSKKKRELLIFLTPTIVSPEGNIEGGGLTALPKQELYTNDKWRPTDNAKPDVRNFLPWAKKEPAQNFSPK